MVGFLGGSKSLSLEPKFKRHAEGERLPRIFVDREECLDAFWTALSRGDPLCPKVLVFWGLGGIGKSRLRRELTDRLARADPQPLWGEVDFSLPSLREAETALFSLRRQLSDREAVRFPTFDLAYAQLWRLARPNAAPFQQDRPLFEAGNLAASLLSSAGVPLVSFVAQAVEKGSKPLKNWWLKRGREDLQELARLEPAGIEERLPLYLAEDLADHLVGKESRAVLFFDTYESTC